MLGIYRPKVLALSPLPQQIGSHKVVPAMAAPPFTEIEHDESLVTFVWPDREGKLSPPVRAFVDPAFGAMGTPLQFERPENATLADLIALVPLAHEALRPHLRVKLGEKRHHRPGAAPQGASNT